MINEDCQHCFKYQIKKKKKDRRKKKKKSRTHLPGNQETGKEPGIFIVNLTFFIGL